jgi:hypothetical protein
VNVDIEDHVPKAGANANCRFRGYPLCDAEMKEIAK